MRDMGMTDADVERRCTFVGLGNDDIARVAALRDLPREYTEEFTGLKTIALVRVA